MRSRRGMSPLIATVLLIAFAVALGAMIMNWEPAGGGGCANVLLSSSKFCHTGNTIKLKIHNKGSQDVVKTALALGEEGRLPIPEPSGIPANSVLEKDLPDYYNIVKEFSSVGIVPKVQSGKREVECGVRLPHDELPECTS
ncbi:hypothetical protein D6783_03985 [Candidatus Woesearchaeota archaeon]|nr:MAG: hypothetical protein D6783_03985 [Candidatus Woesearchaeota archaeon]